MASVFVSSSAGCSGVSNPILGDDAKDLQVAIDHDVVVGRRGSVLLRLYGCLALTGAATVLSQLLLLPY